MGRLGTPAATCTVDDAFVTQRRLEASLNAHVDSFRKFMALPAAPHEAASKEVPPSPHPRLVLASLTHSLPHTLHQPEAFSSPLAPDLALRLSSSGRRLTASLRRLGPWTWDLGP